MCQNMFLVSNWSVSYLFSIFLTYIHPLKSSQEARGNGQSIALFSSCISCWLALLEGSCVPSCSSFFLFAEKITRTMSCFWRSCQNTSQSLFEIKNLSVCVSAFLDIHIGSWNFLRICGFKNRHLIFPSVFVQQEFPKISDKCSHSLLPVTSI